MTPEEKKLLFIDICERLPYGVIVSYQVGKNTPVNRVLTGKALDELMRGSYVDEWLKCSFKPYLRSMSSMTEEELKEFRACSCVYDLHPNFHPMMCNIANELNMFDWLNAHHFDYRGLIPMGLALEAKEGMYKIE